jgi:hypothetical protein
MNILKFFIIVAILLYISNLTLFTMLHFQKTKYNPIRHAVSDYGVGPTKPMFLAYILCSNLGALALSFVLLRSSNLIPIPTWIPILMIFLVALRIFMSVFPTDLEGQRLTTTGKLHYGFAILSFTFSYIILSNGCSYLKVLSDWRDLSQFFSIIKIIASVSLGAVVLTMVRPFRFVFGLCERVFLLSVGIWFLVVSIWVCVKIF